VRRICITPDEAHTRDEALETTLARESMSRIFDNARRAFDIPTTKNRNVAGDMANARKRTDDFPAMALKK
jgi:hypothetical protein